jgi:hypothetical protein
MKRILSFLAILGLVLAQACKPEKPVEPTLSVSPNSLSFAAEGGSQTINVSAGQAWTASVTGTGFSISPSSGKGDGTVTVTAKAAASTESVSGSVTFKSESLSASVSLSQAGKTPQEPTVLNVGEPNTVPAEGGTVLLPVEYNTDYKVEVEASAKSWISIIRTKAVSNGQIELSISRNEGNERTGKITVTEKSGDIAPIELTVVQLQSKLAAIHGILDKVYEALDGRYWKTAWVPGEVWPGFVYDAENDRASLSFRSFGLKGEIPECIGELGDCLFRFEVDQEPGLTGTLPDSFRNLTGLESLTIRNSGMKALPDVFSGMTALNTVQITDNESMTGSLPESLGSSPVLTTLTIGNNSFTGGLPESWAKHTGILSAYYNCLTGKVTPFFSDREKAIAFVNNGNLWQKEGYGFDISDVEIPGCHSWPEYEPNGHKTVENFDGKTFTFEDVIARNKYTLYISWTPWDQDSRRLMPQLKDLYETCHQDGFEIIATVKVDQDYTPWSDKEGLMATVQEKGYDQWYNFHWWASAGMPKTVPTAEVYDSKGNIVFSSVIDYPDPVRNRFGKNASTELIPFLESVLEPKTYASTDYSKDGDVLTLQTATVGNGINVVLMGDAYTDKDMGADGLYETVMKQAMEEFFAIAPYDAFRDCFNVYAVKVVSANGKVGSGYATALGAVFGDGTEITCNTEKCEEYALKVPSVSSTENLLTIVMVHDSGYRGQSQMSQSKQSGISFVTTEGYDPYWFGNTIRHECGHAFAFLGDESASSDSAIPAAKKAEIIDLYNKYGWYSNIDFTSDPEQVHWHSFLTNYVYRNEVGIYEGGLSYGQGVFRPSESSMMRDNLEYFNAPSRLAIFKRIMELSGEGYSLEKFLEYDEAQHVIKAPKRHTPSKAAAVAARHAAKHTAAPRLIK